jgi:hypothetical protein
MAWIAPTVLGAAGLVAGNNQNKANQQAQQQAQGNAQQFSVQQQQAAYAHDDAMKQAAMQALTNFQQQHPNPLYGMRGIQGPNSAVPQSIGGGIMGQGGQMAQPGQSGMQPQPPAFDPSPYLKLMQQILSAHQPAPAPAPAVPAQPTAGSNLPEALGGDGNGVAPWMRGGFHNPRMMNQ